MANKAYDHWRKFPRHLFYEARRIARECCADTFTADRYEDDPLFAREFHAVRVRRAAENGLVVLMANGMDCDCVAFRYKNCGTFPAAPRLIEHIRDQMLMEAEGPLQVWTVSPSEAKALKRVSRDLGAEAYEDGHPHRVAYPTNLEA